MNTKLMLVAFGLVGLVGCMPGRIDNARQTSREIAEWLAAGQRLEAATGIRWRPREAPCSGRDCAQEVDELKSDKPGMVRLGEANPLRAQAKVVELREPEKARQVKLHELLHTAGVLHVDANSIMNPLVSDGRDCISEAELFQLCSIVRGRCSRQVPECHVSPGWSVLVPVGSGRTVKVSPKQWREALRDGQDLVNFAKSLSK